MTDRELMELAAKAAGIELEWPQDYGGADHLSPHDTSTQQNWNPITDDGDALRLAVKLNLDILQDPVSSKDNAVEVQGNFENVEFQPWAWENRAPDLYAATRRAIVRVAAEIGKLTKN